MSRFEGGSRSATASPPERHDDLPPLSRYKSAEMIKTNHEEKHAKRKGHKDKVPSYMKPTVASLQKRQSFRYSGELSRGRLGRRRTQSMDPEIGQHLDREKERGYNSFRPPLEMISDESSDGASSEDYVVNVEEDAPVNLERLRDDVERAYNQIPDSRRLRRNSTGNNRRIEGGISPLPSRASDHLTDAEDPVESHPSPVDVRPHSATDVAVPFRGFAFDRREVGGTGELPLPVEDLDVPLAGEMQRDEGELLLRPSAFAHSGSFDSTAAITTSPNPQPRALSPYLDNPKNPATDEKISRSHLNHTLPKNVEEIQDNAAEAEHSDGPKGSAEDRCQSGAVISGSAPSGGYVQITEEKRHEVRRPSDVHNRPNIKGSLILAGIFAGVAIIIGKIFSSRD